MKLTAFFFLGSHSPCNSVPISFHVTWLISFFLSVKMTNTFVRPFYTNHLFILTTHTEPQRKIRPTHFDLSKTENKPPAESAFVDTRIPYHTLNFSRAIWVRVISNVMTDWEKNSQRTALQRRTSRFWWMKTCTCSCSQEGQLYLGLQKQRWQQTFQHLKGA